MVSKHFSGRHFADFEGQHHEKGKTYNTTLVISKELLGRRRKRKGIEINEVLDKENREKKN
jgi:hypothetical protein